MSFVLFVVLFTAISTPGCWTAVVNFTETIGDRFNEHELYTNSWVVEVNGDESLANEIAERHGFINRGPVGSLLNHYFFEHKVLSSRTRRSTDVHESLSSHENVIFAKQQKVLRRSRRGYQPFTDPLFKKQWYLQNTGQTVCPSGLDVNVVPVWASGYSGKGVVVAILDDGLEYTHPDLKKNYYAAGSHDYNNHDSDPIPRYSSDNINKHGTRCAGEVAAEANNQYCGVGIAYNSKVSGIRMLDGDVTDAVEGGSLSFKPSLIDIYSSSWGPDDDGRTVDGPGPLAKDAFKKGTLNGRHGRGAIFIWATGNGGRYKDYCSCDGYINSIYTISIGAVNDCGKSPWYAEPCPGTLAVTYSSGLTAGPDKRIVTTDLRKRCTEMHTGTSAAAPLAAGIFALVLEANPMLTWRDLQHLVVNTSKQTDAGDSEWQKNGAGLMVNSKFGFGVLDANALVTQALKWRTVPEQHFCESEENVVGLTVPPRASVSSVIHTAGCSDQTACITKLEHVHAIITLKHAQRGRLEMVLHSPAGTKSQLLKVRERDMSRDGFNNWAFLSVFNWGENPAGYWKLTVTDTSGFAGILVKWQLHFYGTCSKGGIDELSRRNTTLNETQVCMDECKKGCPVPFSQKCIGCSQYCDCETGECVSQCQKNEVVDYQKRHCRRTMETPVVVQPMTHTDHSPSGTENNKSKPLLALPNWAQVAMIGCAIALCVVIVLAMLYIIRQMPRKRELRASIAYCPVATKQPPKFYVDADLDETG